MAFSFGIFVLDSVTIGDQLQADPEALAERASKIKALGKSFTSAKIFEMLTSDDQATKKTRATPIKHEGKVIGKISQGPDGEVSLSIKPGYVSAVSFAKLQIALGELIGK